MKEQAEQLGAEQRLEQLRKILLRDERKARQEIEHLLDDPSLLSEKVKPIIADELELLKAQFPATYEKVVRKIIEEELKGSQEEILNVIYPVLGKMIRKYISHQIQQLKDKIDAQIRYAFSKEGFWRQFKARLLGIKASDQVIKDLQLYTVEELYVIQRHSGLLMGAASRQKTIDQDVIAGMLTAIKAFVEDAFKREKEELELIEYGNYQILLQNYYSYYIATAVSGAFSSSEKEALSDRLLQFAEEELGDHQALDESNFEYISQALAQRFFRPVPATQPPNLHE